MYVIFLQLLIALLVGVIFRIYVHLGKAHQLKIIQKTLKILISVGTLWSVAHVAMLIFGINEPFFEQLFGFSFAGLVLLFMSAFVLDLCLVFKACCIYCYLVSECIILQEQKFFGEYIYEARGSVLGIGICLIVALAKTLKTQYNEKIS